MAETVPRYSNEDGTEDFGDFAKDEDEEMDIGEEVEDIWRYASDRTPDVLYPIRLGDVIHERYLVEHKLGAGGFATVWMAHDLQENTDVALKIMSAGESGDRETRIQDEIIQRMSAEDASRFVIYSQTFLLPGNGCHHRVQVFPLMGPFLDPTMQRNTISMATRMFAARQLLEALEILHKVGIVHGDLSYRNCMWGMAPLHNVSRSTKYEIFGRPLKQLIPIDDIWKKGEIVRAVEIPEKMRTEKFYLGDFGLAKKLDDPITLQGYPPEVNCSPERFHGVQPTVACDMWSYMTLFAGLYIGYDIFPNLWDGAILSSHVRTLGPLPQEWKSRCFWSNPLDSWYDPSTKPHPRLDLALKLARHAPETDPIEREHVRSIMLRVFVYNPEERLTASQLLRDPSFRAIMERYGC